MGTSRSMNICPNCFGYDFSGRCSICEYVGLVYEKNHMLLRPGITLANRYTVGRVLGAGGFGITYLVLDNKNNTRMAVKEYLPTAFAVRDGNSHQVFPSSSDNTGIFDHGLNMFDREAESLRMFLGNPSIVQVTDNFRQNGTSYYTMEFLDGVNLKALTRSMGGKLPLNIAMDVLQSVGSTLITVHEKGLLHRDVSPENIFVTKQGLIKLIDFGATRFYVGERSQSLSVVLKPGFAPPEQYSSKGNQGPWTDVYALGATILCVLSGKGLPDAPDRLAGTSLESNFNETDLNFNMRRVLEKSLMLNYKERYQNAKDFLSRAVSSEPSYVPVDHSHGGSSFTGGSLPMQHEFKSSPFIKMAKGEKWLIPANFDIKIGRAPDRCNIILDDKDVSRVHCMIRYDSKRGVFLLTDQSSNGTFMQGERMTKNVTQTLLPGSMFVLPGANNKIEAGVE